MRHRLFIILALVACFLMGALVSGQTSPSERYPDPQFGQRRNEADPLEEKAQKDRDKAINKQRYADLKKDSDKLLDMATQLKQYVDKTNENVLSLEVVRKAEEIERLAKSVRERMKAVTTPTARNSMGRGPGS